MFRQQEPSMRRVKLARRLLLAGAFASAVAALAAPADADVFVRVGPPAPRYEPIPPVPAGPHRWIWTPGYWRWDGARYIWAPGRYVWREHGNWRPGYWDHRPGGWVWVEGRWR